MKINIKMAFVAGVISVSILAGGLPAEAHPGSKDNTTKVTTEKKSLQERIHAILYPEGDPEEKTVIEDVIVDHLDDPSAIAGNPMATRAQCVRFLLAHNPHPSIAVSPEELVDCYYEEAAIEGIRPDVAFVQAIKETGFFRYGGTVLPEQNNYCGLGTTSAYVKGGYFPSARIGVRAHIQHLMAYSTTRRPKQDIVDPRYTLVRNIYGSRTLLHWEDLNGRWAVPGDGYGESILSIHRNLLKY